MFCRAMISSKRCFVMALLARRDETRCLGQSVTVQYFSRVQSTKTLICCGCTPALSLQNTHSVCICEVGGICLSQNPQEKSPVLSQRDMSNVHTHAHIGQRASQRPCHRSAIPFISISITSCPPHVPGPPSLSILELQCILSKFVWLVNTRGAPTAKTFNGLSWAIKHLRSLQWTQ